MKPTIGPNLVARLSRYGFALTAMLVPAAAQFIVFAFYARILGPERYGDYIAMTAWVPICFELVALGAGEAMIRVTARDASAYPSGRRHFMAALLTSLPIAVAVFVTATLTTTSGRYGWLLIAALGVSEFVGQRLFVGAEQGALALGRITSANWFRISQAFPRIVGVGIAYYLIGLHSIEALALAGAIAVLIGGIIAEVMVRAIFPRSGPPQFRRNGLREGFWFMSIQLLRAGQQNIDRIVLSIVADPATLALFGAAQRFVQVGMLPIQTVLRQTYSGFFREGRLGIRPALHYGLRVLILLVAIGAGTAGTLVLASGLAPLILGVSFDRSVTYLTYLAPTLVLVAVNYVGSDCLSGADRTHLRTLLTALSILVQIVCFWLWHDGLAIVVAAYVGLGLSALLTWSAVLLGAYREARRSAAGARESST